MNSRMGLLTLIALTITHTAFAGGTDVSGQITENTTWGLAGSPYRLVGEVYVEEGVVLTIESGVEVSTTSGLYELHVLGHVDATGVLFSGAIPEVFAEQSGTLSLSSCTFDGDAAEGLIWFRDESSGSVSDCVVDQIWTDPHAGATVEDSTVRRFEIRQTCSADTNNDSLVDFLDLLALLAAWGPCP